MPLNIKRHVKLEGGWYWWKSCVWYYWCCTFKADSHIACHAHAVPLPCRADKGLECLSHLILRRTAWSEHGMGAACQV
jgi:hypothetical protein